MNKKALSERDICTKFITPNIVAAGWNVDTQIREEVGFTDGRINVRGKIHARGAQKRADYILYYKPNIPIAVIEAKDNFIFKDKSRVLIVDHLGLADQLKRVLTTYPRVVRMAFSARSRSTSLVTPQPPFILGWLYVRSGRKPETTQSHR